MLYSNDHFVEELVADYIKFTFTGAARSFSSHCDILLLAWKRLHIIRENNWLTVALHFQKAVFAAFLGFRPIAKREWLCKDIFMQNLYIPYYPHPPKKKIQDNCFFLLLTCASMTTLTVDTGRFAY